MESNENSMISGNAHSYRRYLLKLPWRKQGLFTNVGVKLAFTRIRESFENSGLDLLQKMKNPGAFALRVAEAPADAPASMSCGFSNMGARLT